MHRLLVTLLLVSACAFAREPSPVARQEINHLVSYLKHSGCQFNRNGSWYATDKAVEHVNEKFQYLLKRDLVTSAEDFIARAASESSFSGKAYLVKCGSAAPQPSGPWLQAELDRYRRERH
jgi:hypothetical protein